MAECITSFEGGVEVRVKVVPGASRDRIAGMLGNALKLQVAAAPERGRANAAVAAILAKTLRVGLRDVTVVRGQTSPMKVIRISGVTAQRAAELLGIS